MITVKQVQRASCSARRNAFYLVKSDDIFIGMIEKPYHSKEYRVQIDGRTIKIFSTKKQAIRKIVAKKRLAEEIANLEKILKG